MHPIVRLKDEQVLEKLPRLPHHDNYLAMYSSVYGGIIQDPRLMLVPVDDHIVHRGDGIFEAFKSIDRKIYLLQSHLDRLRVWQIFPIVFFGFLFRAGPEVFHRIPMMPLAVKFILS